MADLDTFLQDDGDAYDWDSDTGSVEQDPFNMTNLKKANGGVKDENEVPLNSKKVSNVSLDLEEEGLREEKELEQAKQFDFKENDKKMAVPTPYKSPSPKMGKKKTSIVANIVKKPSMTQPNVERKVSMVSVTHSPSKNHGDNSTPFQSRYSPEVVAFFTEINKKPITQQAIEYLNAYWDEVGDQAEFIFSVAIKVFREADMHRQGITLYYKYDEGSDVDYPTYLYFYEKLVKYVTANPEWKTGQYEKSAVYEVKTAIKHKNDLKEKVDVNFDGRISFLEYLLYQYNVFSNPADYMQRAKMAQEEHPAITAARQALDEVNARIRAYNEEKARLTEGAKQGGVKGLTFKHQLKMLDTSPLGEELNKALITAEAAVRLAVKKFQSGTGAVGTSVKGAPRGALWWMQRDLDEKKRVIVPATLRRAKKNKKA